MLKQLLFLCTVCLYLLSFSGFVRAETEAHLTVKLTMEEQAWLEQHGPVSVVGEYDQAPLDFVDSTGVNQGIAWEYLELISQRTGIQFNKQVGEWNHSLQRLRNNDVDMVPAAYFTDQRAEFMRFSLPVYSTLVFFFIRDDVAATDLSDLAGLRVAIPRGYANIDFIREYYPEITVIETSTMGEAVDKVLQNQAELLFDTYAVVNYLLQKDGIQSIKPFQSVRDMGQRSLFFGIRQDLPLLQSIVNKGLNSITSSERQVIKRRWLGNDEFSLNGVISFSDEEIQWLQAHPHIRFGGDPNWLPYEAFEQGEYIGIVAEYLKHIETKLNIRLERVPTTTWAESVAMAKNGQLDVLSETSDSTLNSDLLFTKPYLSSPIVIVMRNEVSYVQQLEQLRDKKIAMIHQYGYVNTIKKAYPDIAFAEVASIQEGLTAVSTGQIDVLLATLAQASFHISDMGVNNIRIVGETEFRTQLAFGIRKDFAPLVTLFNRAIDDLSMAERQHIVDEWGQYKFASQYDYALAIKLAVGFLIFMAWILLWNKRLRKEMRFREEAQTQTKDLIDNIPLQIVVTAYSGEIIIANPKALNDYKLTLAQARTFNILDVYAKQSDRLAVLEEIKQHGSVKERIINFKRWDGSEHAMMVSVMPIIYEKRPALLSIAIDMTERLEMEAELLKAKERAEIANKSKSNFLANMSHEIRTPMNAIIGFTELLEEQVTDAKQLSYIKTIHSAGNDLLLLINDILDLSKIEAGKVEIKQSASNLHSLFEELQQIFKLALETKGLEIVVEVDPALPDRILLDVTRLRQVLVNLLGNAIKFTEQGYIKLIAMVEAKDEEKSQIDLRIDIEDTGIGIAPEQMKTIFNEFEQSQGQDQSRYGGTGLGLSISLRLIELMGGYMGLDSKVGKGSTFTVHLKSLDIASMSREDSSSVNPAHQHIIFEPATILVVDDIENNRRLVAESFANTNIAILQAENGQQAIEVYEQHDVDLILMDLRMPVMTGYEAAKYLKQHHQVPIVALTASFMKEDFEQAQADYFDEYIRKPVRKESLFSKLAPLLAHHLELQLEEDKTIRLNAVELKQVTQVLTQLAPFESQLDEIKESNNLSEIQVFANDILQLANQYQFRPLQAYALSLLERIDIFDIDGIRQALQEFEKLVEQIKQQS